MMTAKDIVNQLDIPQEHRDALERAIEMVWHEGYKAAMRWISVEDKLPEPDSTLNRPTSFLVKGIDLGEDSLAVGFCIPTTKKDAPIEYVWCMDKPTHWLPIPLEPQKDQSCTPTVTPQGE